MGEVEEGIWNNLEKGKNVTKTYLNLNFKTMPGVYLSAKVLAQHVLGPCPCPQYHKQQQNSCLSLIHSGINIKPF